ncbi:MAG: hypothetical protein ACTSPU_09145 [Promethearchaeota archaeon]|jgi:hypothetical protein|nr:hypothetical protein [Candidatus Lokiarchaeota archaeon]
MSIGDKSLSELTEKVFSEKYEFINGPQKIKGKSGKVWTFNALIRNGKYGKYGVFVRDWKREISITQLRQLHKACVDIPEIEGGIMVCNIDTDFSRDYSSQFGIQLLSRGRLVSKLRNREFQF